jgi:hypothetical protein
MTWEVAVTVSNEFAYSVGDSGNGQRGEYSLNVNLLLSSRNIGGSIPGNFSEISMKNCTFDWFRNFNVVDLDFFWKRSDFNVVLISKSVGWKTYLRAEEM